MITAADRRKYALPTKQDERILEKIKALEKKRLTAEEKKMLAFCKTQLKNNWRTPLEKAVDQLASHCK